MQFRQMAAQEFPQWYEQELCAAFIPQERKPLPVILQLLQEGRYALWGLFDAGQLAGYAALWTAPDVPLVLLDYLGVTEALRNRGLGSRILRHLQAQGRPIVLESEMPVPGDEPDRNQLRTRRIAFYRRSGFVPVYRMGACGMAWQALAWDPAGLSLPDMMQYHRALYGSVRTDICIPLPEGVRPDLPYWVNDKSFGDMV